MCIIVVRGDTVSEVLKGFWVLEGLDGAGTTTQLRNIRQELENRGVRHFITCEPTTNETGRFLRRILSGEIELSQASIAHMFATDRQDHLDNPVYGIRKNLSEGNLVVSDRYFFSSLAYQSIGYDFDSVSAINSTFPYPEVVIFIDTPEDDCIRRIDSRGDRKEIYEKLEFQRLVRENYYRCFENLPEGCRLLRIDGRLSREEIFRTIVGQLF